MKMCTPHIISLALLQYRVLCLERCIYIYIFQQKQKKNLFCIYSREKYKEPISFASEGTRSFRLCTVFFISFLCLLVALSRPIFRILFLFRAKRFFFSLFSAYSKLTRGIHFDFSLKLNKSVHWSCATKKKVHSTRERERKRVKL